MWLAVMQKIPHFNSVFRFINYAKNSTWWKFYKSNYACRCNLIIQEISDVLKNVSLEFSSEFRWYCIIIDIVRIYFSLDLFLYISANKVKSYDWIFFPSLLLIIPVFTEYVVKNDCVKCFMSMSNLLMLEEMQENLAIPILLRVQFPLLQFEFI